MLDEVSLDLIISWQPEGGFVANNSGFLCARSLVIILLFTSVKKVHKTWAAVTTDLETKRSCYWLHWDITITAGCKNIAEVKGKINTHLSEANTTPLGRWHWIMLQLCVVSCPAAAWSWLGCSGTRCHQPLLLLLSRCQHFSMFQWCTDRVLTLQPVWPLEYSPEVID